MRKALVVLGALAVVLAIVVPPLDDNTIRSEDIHQGANRDG